MTQQTTETTETWIGADGNVLPDRNGAVAVEINQVDNDGLIVQRTYATLEGGKPTTPFTDVEDEDQTQALSWDLWVEDADGALKPVDTLDEFWAAFELEDETGLELVSQVCHILELPVWDVAPEKLQTEVYAWLRKQSPGAKNQEKALPVEYLQTDALPFPVGEKREAARVESDVRIRRWEQSVEDLLTSFYDRQQEVVLARLRGTKARRGTRHWTYAPSERPARSELKALNAETIVQPGRWADEIQGDAEKLMLRLFRATADDTTTKLGTTPIGLDSPTVRDMVAEHVRRIMSSTETRARQVMETILDLDKTEADLEEVVHAVIGTYEQRQIWAATTARTETTGAVNGASFIAAREAGVTTKQWLSSRDEDVRLTHRAEGGGDGQTVPLLAPFIIGGAPLMYPGDPFGPPDQTINCRCVAIFEKPEPGADRDAALQADGVLPLLGDGVARVYDQLNLDTPDFFDQLDDTPATEALVSAMTALLNALRGHIRAVRRASKPDQRDEALANAAEYRKTAVSLMTEIAGASAAQGLNDRLVQTEAV